MVKNGMCLGSASKQNALFSENMPQKTYPGSRIDHAIWYVSSYINGNAYFKNAEAFSADIYLLEVNNQTQEQDAKSLKS